ncbi:AAA family ATPase [Nonomuraea sp. NPDC050536]|uniref:AAA family ATPase n=1 Tax=Nonomuraea sp. NPDC050536 TaxID=3364366 RepID=UPI0037CAC3E3
MRPHRLSLTAFGSFPGSETVDFDSLAEAGLFLIHGPTGAGKTTILDALCFALYGQVPGQRNSARTLRCDHAPAGTGPSVTLSVTIRGRLFRIQRSPAWQRPKLRGSGFTEEKAKVIVEERLGDAWHGLTTRADEAGDLIGGLLGMNADQFCQVAMLPQGDFAKFLRADGDDRRKLLERLFTVKTFTQAETWLAEHRKQTWRDQQSLRQEVDYALQRLQEAAGPHATPELPTPSPTTPTTNDLTASPLGLAAGYDQPSSPGTAATSTPSPTATAAVVVPDVEVDPLGWAGWLVTRVEGVVARTSERFSAGEQALRTIRTRYEQAAALADRQRRHAEALTLRRTLDERADERADLEAILDEATRADRVLPLITAAHHRAETYAKARTLATDAVARAHPLLTPSHPATGTPTTSHPAGGHAATGHLTTGHPTTRHPVAGDDVLGGWGFGVGLVGRLAGMERERQGEIARLSELLTEEARLSVVRRDLGRVEEELTGLVAQDEAVARRLAVLPDLVEAADRELARARVDAARVPAAESLRDAAADLVRVEEELVRLAAAAAGLEEREAGVAATTAELPDRLAEARDRLAETRDEAAAIPAVAAVLDGANTILDAVRRRDALTAELAAARETHRDLVDRAQSLRERWLDLRQARIDGMAAELARDLADGVPCAVCGSPDHPHPAAAAPTTPSPEDEQAAEQSHETAVAEREAGERHLATLESRLATTLETLASPPITALGPLATRPPATPQPHKPSPPSEPAKPRDTPGESIPVGVTGTGEPGGAVFGAWGAVGGFEGLGVRLRAVVEAGGEVSEEAVEGLVRAAEEELGRLRVVAERERALSAEVDRVEAEWQRVADLAREVAEALAATRTHQEHLRTERTRLTARLHPLLAATEAEAPTGVAEGMGVGEVEGRWVFGVAERELAGLRESAAREAGLAAEANRLTQERTALEDELRRVTARLAAGRTRQEELSGDVGRLTARLDSARGDDRTLAARLSRLTDEAELLREALEAVRAAEQAETEHEKARQAARAAAEEAGFGDPRDALAAARPAAERERKAELLRTLDAQHAAVTATLDDPELKSAAEQPRPDLTVLEAERDRAELEHTALASERDQAESRLRRLRQLTRELEECLVRWEPAAERHRLAERMAALASGTSADNQWSMSLSSFVLGERLRQVVDAANDRLDHMSAGRYLLRHDLRKTAGARGRSGGGLGLRVADGWTGVDRDPATLSGGESFITSLALALGLADVVTAEAGGAELGTLFVDEGFGTLDEDTLDGVLDILDGLRDGGRAVGIVSHVAELRSRITAQLKVTKARTGSTLACLPG